MAWTYRMENKSRGRATSVLIKLSEDDSLTALRCNNEFRGGKLRPEKNLA